MQAMANHRMHPPQCDTSLHCEESTLAVNAKLRPVFTLMLCCLTLLLAACASKPYQGNDPAKASFLQRAQTQFSDTLKVRAAVPDAQETQALTGLDLYSQGIQPIWLEVENRGEVPARLTLWSIDRNYFSPIEVAYMNRKGFSDQAYQEMQRWFYNNGMTRHVAPGETTSGLVFTHLVKGTKGFNLDIFSNRQASSFTFFAPLPGFSADYMRVDFEHLYPPEDIRELDLPGLKKALEEELDCCATGVDGESNGGPLNTILVGSSLSLRRALLRGEWLDTAADDPQFYKERQRFFLGRSPDAIFYKERADGEERLQLHLWQSPWRVATEPVWVGQVYYRYKGNIILQAIAGREGLQDKRLLSRYVRESVSADMDSARRYLMQNVWYNNSLTKVGLVAGAGITTQEEPAVTHDDHGYFTDGLRVVMFLSETPVALDDAQIFDTRHNIVRVGR